MQLIKAELNRCPLDKLNTQALAKCDEVWAAVAYVTDDSSLIKPCYKQEIPLRLWARVDYSIPVNMSILEWFLGKSPLAVCKLVRDVFHPKVIWWRPYGVYIGSANLTHSAWGSNFEAGLFLTEDELEDHGIKPDLEDFFNEIDVVSHLLSKEIVDKLKDLQKDPFFESQERFHRNFDNAIKDLLPKPDSLLSVQKRSDSDKRRRTEFLREWNQTLTYIRDIASRLSDRANRPAWVHADVPTGVHADQFLHAYYYQKVMEGHRARHREFHKINKLRPHEALDEALRWWASLPSAPSSEAVMMHEHAPFIAASLTRENIKRLTKEEFVEVFSHVHAFRNYADRTSHKTLGLQNKLEKMTTEERGVYLAQRLYSEVSESGEGILKLLEYLLYGGTPDELPQRLYEISFSREHSIKFAGLSTFGEIVGWALPSQFPPRNGRTSKALYALGYDVKIHTE